MKMFQTKVVQILGTHILCSAIFFFENRTIYNVGKYCITRQATDDMMHAHCILDTQDYTHSSCVTLTALLSNNGCTNAPHCYVPRELPVLLVFEWLTALLVRLFNRCIGYCSFAF
jgi:hypothetical protein